MQYAAGTEQQAVDSRRNTYFNTLGSKNRTVSFPVFACSGINSARPHYFSFMGRPHNRKQHASSNVPCSLFLDRLDIRCHFLSLLCIAIINTEDLLISEFTCKDNLIAVTCYCYFSWQSNFSFFIFLILKIAFFGKVMLQYSSF